ncbi:hypothetical protein C8R44DRAFT_982834 [Mycena epipterygia]|nr:hypothetical protein C8R44DRAFT_982834 [Mycena epipterygia]
MAGTSDQVKFKCFRHSFTSAIRPSFLEPLPPATFYSILGRCNALTTRHLSILDLSETGDHAHWISCFRDFRPWSSSDYARSLHQVKLPSLEDMALIAEYIGENHLDAPAFPTVRHLWMDATPDAPVVELWVRACPSAVEISIPFSGFHTRRDR